MDSFVEAALRNLPREVGLHCTPFGRPWALVRKEAEGVNVYIWAADDPFPSHDELRTGFSLTPTQAKVAKLLLHRRTNAEIAEALDISVHTARRHVEAVLLRMSLRSRFDVERRVCSCVANLRGSGSGHNRA